MTDHSPTSDTRARPDPVATLAGLEGVPSALAAARDAADAVLRDRGARRVSAQVSAAALLAGARASARLEALADPSGHDWTAGAIRLSTRMRELAPLVRRAPGQVIAQAHTLLAQGLVPDAGRLADGIDPRPLFALLTEPTRAPALAVAALAHAELATGGLVGPGAGIVARAVEHLVLIEAGIDAPAALVPEVGHEASGPAYDAALQAYRGGQTAGVRDWLLHCAQALTVGAEQSPVRGQVSLMISRTP